MQVYISDYYPEFYIVYPDQKHYITLNYAAGYSYHMYNWQQFFGKKWCQEHIRLIGKTEIIYLDNKPYILVRKEKQEFAIWCIARISGMTGSVQEQIRKEN